MSLKTDYQDAMYAKRKFRMENNSDGTVSLTDATSYTQEGTPFGANDVNAITKSVNALYQETIVTIPANAWSTSAPYSQKVSVPTVKATDSVTMGKAYTKDNTLEEIETWDEMAGLITSAEVSDGYVTFYSKSEKPSRTFKVKLKGVK
jgi:hypothetical protein|nr:MAG TPA: hypothetical protein [Caudoviricetes sp.]